MYGIYIFSFDNIRYTIRMLKGSLPFHVDALKSRARKFVSERMHQMENNVIGKSNCLHIENIHFCFIVQLELKFFQYSMSTLTIPFVYYLYRQIHSLVHVNLFL